MKKLLLVIFILLAFPLNAMDTFIKSNPALGQELQEKWSEINKLIRNQGIHNAEKAIQESNEYLKRLGIGFHLDSYA